MTGHIRPNSLQALKLISINGPSTAAELDALDPENGDHKQIIKVLEQCKFVVSDLKTRPKGEPTRYSLTLKARSTLQGLPQVQPQAKASRRYANAHQAHTGTLVAGPRHFYTTTTDGTYQPAKDMLAPPARVGADAALAIPSRHGDRLHYRDGRVAHITSMEHAHHV